MEETIRALRAARLRRGIAQAEIAASIGSTQSAVARLEAAQLDPRLGTVARYAKSVGMRLVAVPMTTGPSLAETGREVTASLAAHDPSDALRHVIQFLDDVSRAEGDPRRLAVREEPEPVGDPRWDALLAGVAELVSQRFDLPVPGWASAPGRFLHRFWFVVEDILGRPAPGLAALAFTRSPAPLANRGAFLDGDSLASV
ncbi:MAG TPA: helix-turn-helix domain-containing protein [Candidatus Limnocylindrales bacterium]